MSDLIEKFQGLLTIDRRKVSPELTRDEMESILSALKMVRGIEGLAKEGSYVSIDSVVDGSWIIVFGEWDKKSTQKSVDGSTLSLAVEAAVGANEKGGK